MASPLGTQVSELINAARLCKRVFDAFFDQYDNAPSRLRELSELVNTYDWILEQHRGSSSSYPHHRGLKGALDECASFLTRYKSVIDKKRGGARSIALTVYYGALDQQTVARLYQQLNRHVNQMVLWHTTYVYKWTVDRGEGPLSDQRPQLSATGSLPAATSTDDDEPRETQAAQTAKIELDRFLKDMNDLQARLLRPIHRDHVNRTKYFREFLEMVSRHWSSPGLPIDELLDIFVGRDAPDHSLPSEDLEECSASANSKRCEVTVFSIYQIPVRFTGYRVVEDAMNRQREFRWYLDNDEEVLTHYVPFHTIPHTSHAVYNEPHEVSFLQQHKVLVNETALSAEPVLKFTNELDCIAYQRFVRNRELLASFDVDSIKSKAINSHDKEKLAELQLKVWRFRGADNRPTLTFFADVLDAEEGGSESGDPIFFELHLRSFERSPRSDAATRRLRLVFYREREEIEVASPSRRMSILGRRWSSSKTSPTSPRQSVSMETSELLYDSVHAPFVASDQRYAELEYLEIKFTNRDDIPRFLRTSRTAHPRSPLPPDPPRANSTASATLSLHSHLSTSDSVSLPLTPALTEQSVSTSGTGSSAAPSLPELQLENPFDLWYKYDQGRKDP